MTRFISALVLAIALTASAATASPAAHLSEPTWQLSIEQTCPGHFEGIAYFRHEVWRYERRMGARITRPTYAEHNVGSCDQVIPFVHRWRNLANRRAGEYRAWQKQMRSRCLGASPAACAWYLRPDTQCEVDHEGGFTSVSPDGTYAGRFQMDSSFERSTPLGAAAQRRWGRANKWPPGVQIDHAYLVFLKRGWSPWPPYYRFGCAGAL